MYNLDQFDAIIFDFGGVIINIDYHATLRSFEQLGLGDFQTIFSKAAQSDLIDNFEKGLISEDAFFETVQSYIPSLPSLLNIKSAWNSMLLDIPAERIQLLKKVRSQVPTYLLSNTNHTHIEAINEYLRRTYQYDSVHSWFNKVYFSYEIHQRKPDVEIFETVIKENGLNPARTLFIDDSHQHIAGARPTGLQVHHLQDDEDILRLFNF